MAGADKIAKEIRLDERYHVEKPLLDQLAGLGWEVRDLDSKQQPDDTFRESFTEVVMLPVLRAAVEGHQSLAGRRSGRGGGQAADRELPWYRPDPE